MKRHWKPGDMAETAYRGVKSTALVVEGRICPGDHPPYPHWHGKSGGWNHLNDPLVQFRPLVVIDPKQIPALDGFEGAVGDILHQLADDCRDVGGGDLDATETVLRWLADQMPKPPKPEEPAGLGAVVEDESGERWVRVNQRTGTQEWRCCDFNGEFRNWPAIAAVRVLSEGVRDE